VSKERPDQHQESRDASSRGRTPPTEKKRGRERYSLVLGLLGGGLADCFSSSTGFNGSCCFGFDEGGGGGGLLAAAGEAGLG
jgi:hypothetical protein